MSLIGCKQIIVRLAFFLLFSVMVDWTFAQNITTTAISTVTAASTLSSLVLAAKHNLALCDTEVSSDERSICRKIMNKLPASAQRYKSVKIYKEKWWDSTHIAADTPDTVHIIDGDLTLGWPILVTADNVVIIGSDNPRLKLSSTILRGLHNIIYSTGKNVLIDGLQIDPRGLFLHHLSHVVNHFIQIKEGSTSINNVSMLSAETADKAIILAEGGTGANNTSSLTLTDVEIRENDGDVHSNAVKTSGIHSVSLKRIKTHNFISSCALFSFKNAGSIKLSSIQSAINNQKVPNASGVLAIYTKPSPNVELDFENVSFSYKVTKQQSPVIIAAKDTISGQLSLAGKNSFDYSAIRHPTGLTVFTKPQEEPAGLTSTESTIASSTTVAATPSTPEYWWSDLPDCASSPYQEYPNLTSSTEWPSTPDSTVTEQPVTATPHLSQTSSVAATTPTTSIHLAASSIQTSPEIAIKSASSTLTTESTAVLSPSTIKPSSAVHSYPYQTSSSDKSKAGHSTSAVNLDYLGFLPCSALPIAIGVVATACFKYQKMGACAALNYLLANSLECLKCSRYMSIMHSQSGDIELGNNQVYDSEVQLIQNP